MTAFGFDDWEQFLTTASTEDLPATQVATPSSLSIVPSLGSTTPPLSADSSPSAASGEFDPFSVVGASLAGGGRAENLFPCFWWTIVRLMLWVHRFVQVLLETSKLRSGHPREEV